ncbi:MAG TPA: SLBB domain-containing protein [Armatimonadota bacterium]|nr:SLBB domain-containing protein [Armatimonadota bacterium]
MRYFAVGLLLLGAAWALGAGGDAEYRLGPQDRITITVLKHAELSGTYTIPPDGVIDVPRAGRLMVSGQTTRELAALLTEKFLEFLKEPDVAVTLSEARVKHAFVLGAVAKPGQYPITAQTRVTELLAAAGDLIGERAELRARLVRGKAIIPLDLPAALAGKSPEANPAVQEGDLLWIEAPERMTVVVSGQVKNPGAVKLKQGATLVDALAAAGDVLERPEKLTITLQRGTAREALAWGDVNTALRDGDVILVERLPVAQIFINGQVKSPGTYELPDGAGVMQAITLAGGATELAALRRVTVMRRDGTAKQVDVSGIVNGQVKENLPLSAGDLVIVPELTDKVAVLGMVQRPGAFLLAEDRPLSVVEAIAQAGGADRKAKLSAVTIIRRVDGAPQSIKVDVNDILKKGQYDKDVPLQAHDIVYVPGSKSLSLMEIVQSAYYLGVLLP